MAELLPCPSCGAEIVALDGLLVCSRCDWEHSDEDSEEPFDITPEGFRSHYQRAPGVPAVPHSLGPATGIQWAELGPTGLAALKGDVHAREEEPLAEERSGVRSAP